MTHLTKVDLDVLREAGRSESGLQVFSLHRRLSLGPAQLALLVRSLAKRELVLLSEDLTRIQVTSRGLAALAESREKVDDTKKVRPDWIHRPRMSVNFPYIPRRSKM